MKDKINKKHLYRILAYLIIIVMLTAGGFSSGIFMSLDTAVETVNLGIATVCRLAIVFFTVLIIYNIGLLVIDTIKPNSHRGSTILTLLRSLFHYLVIIFGVGWGLTIIGVDISTVVASVGLLALIIGFGAERMIADVVTGVFMLFEDQYNVGDIVETNGFRGKVRSIGIRTTTLEDIGGNVKIVNNSDMANVLNRSNHNSISFCDIGIPYETDLEEFEKLIPDITRTIFENHPGELLSEPKYLGVQELGASAVVLRFTAEVGEANIYNGNRILNRDLFIAFRKAGIEVPFTQIDIHEK